MRPNGYGHNSARADVCTPARFVVLLGCRKQIAENSYGEAAPPLRTPKNKKDPQQLRGREKRRWSGAVPRGGGRSSSSRRACPCVGRVSGDTRAEIGRGLEEHTAQYEGIDWMEKASNREAWRSGEAGWLRWACDLCGAAPPLDASRRRPGAAAPGPPARRRRVASPAPPLGAQAGRPIL